jgi:hypothetical protein
VGIGIAEQEQDLEKQHTGCPDRRRPAKPRQDHLSDHWLHLKQEKCAKEYGQTIENGQSAVDFYHGVIKKSSLNIARTKSWGVQGQELLRNRKIS